MSFVKNPSRLSAAPPHAQVQQRSAAQAETILALRAAKDRITRLEDDRHEAARETEQETAGVGRLLF